MNEVEAFAKGEDGLKLNFLHYNPCDDENVYECPNCKQRYGHWEFFRKDLRKGDSFICKKCGEVLRI